jgi:hypothetical protein
VHGRSLWLRGVRCGCAPMVNAREDNW